MSSQAAGGAQGYRRVAMTATGLTVGLITLGGVTRIMGAGMGCGPDWPLCNGRVFPDLSNTLELIEWSHRWVAALLSAMVLCLAALTWKRHREDRFLRGPAYTALAVLVLQVILGAVTVKFFNAAPTVVIHLTNAMLLLAVLVVAVLRSGARLREEAVAPTGPRPEAAIATGFAFVVITFGAFVANYDAGVYCLGFPLCAGTLTPPAEALGRLHYVHRLLAFLFLAYTAGVLLAARRLEGVGAVEYRQAAAWLAGLAALQIGVGAAMMLQMLPTSLRAAHLLVGSLLWVAAVVLGFRSRRLGDSAARRLGGPAARRLDGSVAGRLEGSTALEIGGEPSSGFAVPHAAEPPSRRAGLQGILADLVTLTKPRIISLLLLTTVAPMFITGKGLPAPALVLWVLLGGYLMAGGANTVNMWFDRDIDTLMSRTKLRPIPSGRIPAGAALAFGLAQGAVAFGIFWTQVNPLSAWMAFSGYLFYVLIYTAWLKRLTTQNIVIGGAAGAFPPLVGWTAMTGSLDLAALYLFAIIFFWTPPHFWALALIKRQEYAKAGVPMMPVVAGDHWTKVQMLAYTLMLIPLTVMPSVFGALGLFYAAAALALGGRLLWLNIQVLREQGITPTTWKMYKFSLLYLALLFVAMGVDRAMPFGHGYERGDVLILDRPDDSFPTPGP
ncbi:MAG: heme o synthase [Gemmatimonadota bacterium]|nr:heme o synthase [Gemmatimonadota bacterium]